MKKEIQAVARLSKSKGDQMIPERGDVEKDREIAGMASKGTFTVAISRLLPMGRLNSKQCTLPVPNRMVPAASGCSWYSCSIHSHL